MNGAFRAIAGALERALPILFTARVIGLATLPLLVAAIVWIAIAVIAWNPLTDALAGLIGAPADGAALWQRIAADVVALLMFAALAFATALAAIAVLTMPVIVKTVAARHFPGLAARRGGTLRRQHAQCARRAAGVRAAVAADAAAARAAAALCRRVAGC